jgi:aspartyl-tRNA(Asn)/glutamyl-tRNA(Gln) amidotransferase subunit B
MLDKYDVVIGLEIHAQLITQSKCFSSAPNGFGDSPNESVSLVCAGFPGTLPSLNEAVVRQSIKTALALKCEIQGRSVFARKQYFYPDMPKGYQISQYSHPMALGGQVSFYLNNELRSVHLERAHIEEDAGKSTHFGQYTLIDLNRAGTPLLEIVSKPEITSPQEAAAYARAVRQILRYNNVCDGNLEQGSLRCDCNISLKPKGGRDLGTKVELKNINSFRFIEKALEYEIQRQAQLLDMGQEIIQETRLYDADKNRTISMRKKEEANDYRYFADPDLMELYIETSLIEQIRDELVESPMERMDRFMQDYGLSFQDSELLVGDIELAHLFESISSLCGDPRLACNWLVGDFLRLLNGSQIELKDRPIKDHDFADLLKLLIRKEISGKIAKDVFEQMWSSGQSPRQIIADQGLRQISDDKALQELIDQVLADHPQMVKDYLGGKEKLFGFFVGQVMKVTSGQANPERVNQLLKESLK